MKGTRFLLCILCIIVMFFCSACGFFGEQRYICDVGKVESVRIIRLDKYIEGEYRYEYTVLSQISEYVTFVDQINRMEHSVNWGDPQQMDEQYVVIRIDYNNGDFDLIHPDAQCFNRSGVNQYGYFFFNDEQFDALISNYLTE